MIELIIFCFNIILLSLIINYYFKLKLNYCLVISFFIIWLLFLNVNPYDIDSNKYKILSYIPPQYKPITILYNNFVNLDNLKYPIIFKPSICTRSGFNVKVINNKDEAINYINNSCNKNEIIIQELVDYNIELAVLYEKNILDNKGIIKSIAQKSSNESIIMEGCFGHVTCNNLTNIINDDLNKLFDYISNHIPNFYVGRYDIKCKSIESFINGEFYILEVNGTMGFDSNKYFNNKLNTLFRVQRWFIYRLLIGLKNIILLNGYDIIDSVIVMFISIYNVFKCRDWEKLFSLYT